MPARPKYHPEARILSYCKRVHGEVAGNDNDTRLTEAQRYEAVRKVLGCDPAIVAAKLIQLCMSPVSKWRVDVYDLHRMIVDLHHMVTASPDMRARRIAVEQFELDFEWQASADGGRVAQLEAAE